MAKLKGAHVSKKAQASNYKAAVKAGKNKLLKLQRHLKKHPNDAQSAGAEATALAYTGRVAPKRVMARLNPFLHERDLIALSKNETFASRSLNLLSGRLSVEGHRVLRAFSHSRKVANEASYDKSGKVFGSKFQALAKKNGGSGKQAKASKAK